MEKLETGDPLNRVVRWWFETKESLKKYRKDKTKELIQFLCGFPSHDPLHLYMYKSVSSISSMIDHP